MDMEKLAHAAQAEALQQQAVVTRALREGLVRPPRELRTRPVESLTIINGGVIEYKDGEGEIHREPTVFFRWVTPDVELSIPVPADAATSIIKEVQDAIQEAYRKVSGIEIATTIPKDVPGG